jgi:hypothetical protein
MPVTMRSRILKWLLLPAVFIATTRSASAVVPVEMQLALFTKIWRLDRNFDSAGVVTMVIVYQAGYRESLLVKDDFIATVERLKLPIRCIPLEAGSSELLRKGLSEIRGAVVYVTPLRSVDVAEIARISRERGLRTMTGVPEYVEQGIAVGIGERKDRPLIIINLLGARAEGSDFSSQLLGLARIVGPLS